MRFTVSRTATGASIAVDGKVNGTAIEEDPVSYTGTIDWTNVKLTTAKTGTNFVLSINDTEAATYGNANLVNGGKVGFGVGAAEGSIGSVLLETLEYEAYSWFVSDGWYMSAAEKDMIVATANLGSDDEEDGTYDLTLTSSAGETDFTRLYRASGMYNEVSAEGTFKADAANAQFGLYLSYTDEENYVLALIGDGKIVLTSVVDGDETEVGNANLPADFDATKDNVLKVYAKFADVVVTLNEEDLIIGKIQELKEIDTGNVGAVALGGEVTVKNFTIGGFWQNKTVTEGVWSLRGRRLSTWTIEDDRIVADGSYGYDFKNTLATTKTSYSPANGYHVGAAVTVTALFGEEWKTGIAPYYKDANNHVFVWLAQWNGNTTTITITARLNGQVVGNEWRETAVAYTMQNAVNYLEVSIEGDHVYVYLNKSFAPTVSTSIDGLSNAAAAGYGFNIMGTSATFAQIAVQETRIFTETGTPEITLIGSVPETAEAGAQVKLPVFSATGVGGTTADVAISVTDGDGNAVEVSQNRFTPEKSGTYKVTVTATDAWGNTVSKSYNITVTGGGGCGGSIAVGAASATLILGVGILLVCFMKKKKRN